MPISVQDALRATQAQLTTLSAAPQREAEWLLEHLTGLSRSQQLINEDQLLNEHQVTQLQLLTQRRSAGEPLAYLLGEQHFWSLRLKVSPAVLIPRPETELVVERALHHLPVHQIASALDLGTGSGAIVLAMACERPAAQLLATDCSVAALELARDNATLNQITNINFLHSDWFSNVPSQQFALVVSNPPYIAINDPDVEPSVHQHEPHLALYSGNDGLSAIRHIIEQAPRFLADRGWLVLEHGWQQADAVRELLESAGFSSVASHADLADHARVSEGQWQSHS
ncbi:MAG: peptide chain release factor N(5)-glutamine methyltransferase [Steroidobacteraceae bacterium]